jgi:N-acetylmuramoyl-L-alanine amidase
MRYRDTIKNVFKPLLRLGPLILTLVLCYSFGPTLAQEGRQSTRRIHCMGQSWKIAVSGTSEPDIVLIQADDQALFDVARALGQNLHWSIPDTTLTGVDGKSLALGQSSLEIHGENQTLAVVPQLLNGAVHVPSNGLEGLLNCRVTVKPGRSGAIYVEPILTSVSFLDDTERTTTLQLKTSVPVRKKVFTLSNPKRTVVDLVGLALPDNQTEIDHPVLGTVKLGQFQLAPSVTRVVLPARGGVSVDTKRTLDLYEHQMAIKWPASMAKNGPPARIPTVAIKPSPPNSRQPAIKIGPSDGQPTRAVRPTPKVQEDPDTRPTAPKNTAQQRPSLQSVSWENNRLKLAFDQPVSYSWSRVNTGKQRFVVDFPGVIFPQRKTSLSSSIPGVQAVRVVQNMPEPQPIVRLVCDLEAAIAVEPEGAKDTILYLDFPGRRVSSQDMPKGVGHTSAAARGNPNGRTICIDAGHGGSDPGALNRSVGINESRVTLDISLKLAEILRGQGWNVIMTRTADRDVSWAGSSAKQELGARANVANNVGADLFVSIHANASVNPDINGTSIHWYKSSDYRLAQLLEGGVMSSTGRKNRGLVKNRFYVLAHTEMPAVLIETAFLTNSTEGRLLADPDFRGRIARGIAAGLGVYASRTFPNGSANK